MVTANIIGIASERERALALLYKELSHKATHSNAKILFSYLAEEESEHLKYVHDLEKKLACGLSEDITVDRHYLLDELEIREELRKLETSDSQLEIYRKARDYEKQSMEFYSHLLQHANTQELKKILKNLVDEEEEHFRKLDEIIDFISSEIKTLENAEFGIDRNTTVHSAL